jgi:prophage regulatory protein
MKRVLRLTEVVQRIGLSRATIWRLRREQDFPQALVLSRRAIGFLEHDIEQWIARKAKDTEHATLEQKDALPVRAAPLRKPKRKVA